VKEFYEDYLRRHILPGLGEVPLGTLTTAMVRGWHADILREGLGASTVAKCYRLLRAILNTAVEDRHIAANPCTIQGAGVEPATERPIPSVGEVYALADAVPGRYRALVLLAAFAGLRKGELFGLTRAHVDLFHRTVTVAVQRQQSRAGAHIVGPPKTEAGKRTLALPEQLIPEPKPISRSMQRWDRKDCFRRSEGRAPAPRRVAGRVDKGSEGRRARAHPLS
jgi:integrase